MPRNFEQYILDEGKFARIAGTALIPSLLWLGGHYLKNKPVEKQTNIDEPKVQMANPDPITRTDPQDILQYQNFQQELEKIRTIGNELENSKEISNNLSETEIALILIKKLESFKPNSYRDSAGVITIGYGFTKWDIPNIKMHQTITREHADQLLRNIITFQYLPVINKNIKVPLSNYQKAALLSFAYNIGIPSFTRSTLLKKINNQDPDILKEFDRWSHVKVNKTVRQNNKRKTIKVSKYIKGLDNRRNTEKKLFSSEFPDKIMSSID